MPSGAWPAEYEGSYLFGDFVCGKVFRLAPDGSKTVFEDGLEGSSAVHLAFGPYNSGEALYYTTYVGGGQVRRLAYTAGNGTPYAVASANPTYGTLPLNVNLDGSGSSDPNGDALTYEWDFTNDGTTDATGARTSHVYQEAGTHTAKLTVRDGRGGVDITTVRIDAGNTPPEPRIEAPTPTTFFKVGQRLTLRGFATDAEQGRLADASLSWEVRRFHNGDHWHPYFAGRGNNLTLTAPPPEDLLSTGAGNYLEIRLTATDTKGLSRTVVQRMAPRRVNLRFATRPINLKLKVNGRMFRAPRTFVSWQGYKLTVYAPRQRQDGRTWVFDSWSDGRAARHTITTPATGKKYVATFRVL